MVLFGPLGWLRRWRGWFYFGFGSLLRFQLGDIFVEKINEFFQLAVESLELNVVGIIADLAKNEVQLDLG